MTSTTRKLVAAICALAALGLASCSSAPAKKATTATTAGSTGSTGGAGSTGSTGNSGTTTTTLPAIGAALSTSAVTVTLQQVIDPAQSNNQYEQPDPGDRFVAIKVLIDDTGQASLNNDANTTFTLLGSDDQEYSASFEGVSGCTNFNEGLYTLAPGASVVGCVMYEVPAAVTITQVQFLDPVAKTRATWAG